MDKILLNNKKIKDNNLTKNETIGLNYKLISFKINIWLMNLLIKS